MSDQTSSPEVTESKQAEERELTKEELDEISGGKASNTAGSHTTHNSYGSSSSSSTKR